MAAPAQSAAWDAYLTLTTGLLPALHREQVDSETVKSQLGAVATRILRYAPLWREHGAMLVAALHSAMRLYRESSNDLAGLLHAVADRLYLLSAGAGLPHHDSDDPATP
jgi:hypothetical protein